MTTASESSRTLRAAFPTRAEPVRKLLELAQKVALHDTSVLILGESGVGKDHLAEAIHRAGPRREQPFVKIHCPGLPAELFESELFGYEKGAFTDAQTRKKGRFDLAQKGSIYLDEIADLSIPLQAKLLRVIEERTFTRLGGNVPLALDARILASSSLPPEALLDPSRLRSDLYYRINVVVLAIPPLRERREDIPLLAGLFLQEAAQRMGKAIEGFDAEALELLEARSWPGNVRELRNVAERAALLASEPLVTPQTLPLEGFVSKTEMIAAAGTHRWSLDELESRYIREVLRTTGSNYSESARILGINRKTLLEKRRKYGIE